MDRSGTIAVAHFRRKWFFPTETFLHNTLRACRTTRPVLVGYDRINEDAFPIEAPVLSLYRPGSWSERALRLRVRLHGPAGHLYFDHRRTYALLEREGVRVLHAHFGQTGVRAMAVAERSELPLVTTFYGQDVSQLGDDPEWRPHFEALFRRGDCFLVEGPFMRRRLVEIGCPMRKTLVQRIAIFPERYDFRERAPKPRGEPVRLFFCATFREKKGLAYALEAVARAREEHPDLSFRVAGDGPLRDEIERSIGALGLGGCVELLGMISHDQMRAEMDAADLYVQPSVTAENGDSEGGAPTALLEAQACGLPVLATRHADVPYVVEEDGSALLSDERDTDGLTANLVTLLKEPERWAEMGIAGRVHVERFHDVETEVRRLEELYYELAGEPRGPGPG